MGRLTSDAQGHLESESSSGAFSTIRLNSEQMGRILATKSVGGGSSAVAASSHAACARFRGTDPLITGLTRRNLAKAVGFADTAGGIPQARWMRAMTFERLCAKNVREQDRHDGRRVPRSRPPERGRHRQRPRQRGYDSETARRRPRTSGPYGAATLIYELAVPFVGFEDARATDVKPDFAVVAPKAAVDGPGPG